MDNINEIDSLLSQSAERKDYFLLLDIYRRHREQLPAPEGWYWDAVVHNLAGRDYLSTVAAGRFISACGEGDEDSAEMLYLIAVNRLRRFRYGAAAAGFRKLLRLHRGRMDAEELEESESSLAVCRALRKVGPQAITLNGVREIPFHITSFGHIAVDVACGDHTGRFILDTGANLSTVSLTTARRMGLMPATGSVEVGTATGVRIECGLAHAPSLDMSGITIRNAVFIVMEDSQLSFPEMDYTIEGIIGLPVIRQLGSLRFEMGRIRVGNTRIPRATGPNICLEGLMPLVAVRSGNERLAFTLDTGANRSEYSHGYYTRHTERLESTARETEGLRGGGGGVVRHKTLLLRKERLGIADQTVTIPEMNVIRDDYEFSRGKDGNLGLDALTAGRGFALSFGRMAVYPYPAKSPGKTKKNI